MIEKESRGLGAPTGQRKRFALQKHPAKNLTSWIRTAYLPFKDAPTAATNYTNPTRHSY